MILLKIVEALSSSH